jgi:2,5-diketo-D-gluconate reductase A
MLTHESLPAGGGAAVPASLLFVLMLGRVPHWLELESPADMATVEIADGVEIPMVSMGCLCKQDDRGGEAEHNQLWLQLGGRAIDTANNYGNQREIGVAIKRLEISRDELFLTGKIEPRCDERGTAELALRMVSYSLHELNTSYLDLMMLHFACESHDTTAAAWRGLQLALDKGLVRSIGVSNFGVQDLSALLALGGTPPAINQVQLAIGSHNDVLLRFAASKGIAIQAMAPFLNSVAHAYIDTLARNEGVARIAAKYGKSVAQINLRYLIDHGFPLAVNSFSERHTRENLGIFDFSLEELELAELDQLQLPCVGYALCPDLPYLHMQYWCREENLKMHAFASCCCHNPPT